MLASYGGIGLSQIRGNFLHGNRGHSYSHLLSFPLLLIPVPNLELSYSHSHVNPNPAGNRIPTVISSQVGLTYGSRWERSRAGLLQLNCHWRALDRRHQRRTVCIHLKHRLSARTPTYSTAVFKLGSADQRGSATGFHGVRERIPKSSNCLHGFTVTSVGVRQLCLGRIGVRGQKSLKTADLYDTISCFNASPKAVASKLIRPHGTQKIKKNWEKILKNRNPYAQR